MPTCYFFIMIFSCFFFFSQGLSANAFVDSSLAAQKEGYRIQRERDAWPKQKYLTDKHKAKYKEGEILIKFKPFVSASRRNKIHAKYSSQVVKEFKPQRIHLVKLMPGLPIEEAVSAYSSDADVEYAEPNYIVTALNVPNDPSFSSLWGLHNTGQTGGTSGADI